MGLQLHPVYTLLPRLEGDDFEALKTDVAREARIRQLGALICSLGATRLWRIVCHAEQRRLIRGRSPKQIALLKQRVLQAIAAQESRA